MSASVLEIAFITHQLVLALEITRDQVACDDSHDAFATFGSEGDGKFLEGRVTEQELKGLKEDRLHSIRLYAQFLATMDA